MDIKMIDGKLLTKMFILGTMSLAKEKEEINALNVFPVPDGDTGTNMNLTMQSAVNKLKSRNEKDVAGVAKAISRGSLMGARGNSGVILSQIFRGFSKGLEGKTTVNTIEFADALKMASETAYKAVLKPVEGTILTVVRETAEKAQEIHMKNMAFHDFFRIIIEAANESLEDTPNKLEVLKQAGVVDAGGKGFISILNGFNNAILGFEIEENLVEQVQKPIVDHVFEKREEIRFQYCTEFIIKSQVGDATKLRDEILKLGDSMVFVQDDDIVKVHIHTNNPGIAFEAALKYGELMNVKVDNMKMQHENKLISEKDMKKSKYGFIAVAMGDGIRSIFEDLGVNHVIFGGQTMNPSTEDIMDAINQIYAENIFVLPNNSNIIMAANQAKELSDKNIIVLPTRSIPQGISAMVGYSEDASPKENEDVMNDIISKVKTVHLTYSVRDTSFDSKEIKKGDILGIINGEIKIVEDSIEKGFLYSMEAAIDEDSEVIAIYYGEDVEKEWVDEWVEKLEEKYPDIDFEVYYGGQPLYYFLVSVE
ncbi:MAG: DAK2 domain-containing protein [Clostridiales bacterium]|nr:DAK2 domain-containing protein [Clostridiales bacterium]